MCIKLYILFRLRSVNYKFATLIRIARLYLEDNSPLQAELYINRASILQVRFIQIKNVSLYLCSTTILFTIKV